MGRRLFGTDGVRGTANVHPMTAEVAMQLGRALAYIIRNGTHRHRVVIGKDTRLSGYMLEQALAAGHLLHGRRRAPGADRCPRRASPSSPQSMRADAGVVICASHNPYQDNGIKFFWRDGFKLPDETEAQDRGADGQPATSDRRPAAHRRPGRARPSASTTPSAATSSS